MPRNPLTAPFRFARIARWIYEPDWAPLVSHDVPFTDGLCGEAEVEITAKSSILVGGERRKPSGHKEGEVHPFRLPDGDYAIPGSALQGMARAILEVAAFGRLGPWVEDRKFGIRDLSTTETAKQHYRNRLNSKAGWLMQISKDNRVVFPCQFARIHLNDVLALKSALSGQKNPGQGVLYARSDAKQRYKWFLDGSKDRKDVLNSSFDIADIDPARGDAHPRCSHDATKCPGTLVLTGKPQRGTGPRKKSLEFVFHSPDRISAGMAGAEKLKIPSAAWDAFEFLHEEQPGRPMNPNWAFWKGEFAKGRPVPVFYWEDKDNSDCVETLGMAFAFKAAHRRSARDLLEYSCPGHTDGVAEMKLDLPHLLFGVAAESDGGLGLKRRASFSLARAERAEGKPPKPVKPGNPSVLLGPKPSYVGFYVRQKEYVGQEEGDEHVPRGEPMATYTPLEGKLPHLAQPELAGVKIWPARGAGAFDPGPIEDRQIAENPRIQTRLVTLPPGTRFRSRLNFHNLRPVELGAVLWALSFGDEAAFGGDANANAVTKRHRLGMGKPLGLGEIAIRITGLEADPACPTRGPNLPKRAMEFVRAFEDHMRGAYGKKWRTSKQVAALLKAADPQQGQSRDLQYMPLRDYQSAKQAQRYMPDYAPNGDEKPRAQSSSARKVGSGGVPAADLPLEEGARVRGNPAGPTNIRGREGVVIALGATEYKRCQVLFDGARRPESVMPGLLQVIAPPSDLHTDPS